MFTIEIRRAGYNAQTVTCQPGTTVASLLEANNIPYEGASVRFNGTDINPSSYRINEHGEIRILKNVKGN